jgi:hypothetical protein
MVFPSFSFKLSKQNLENQTGAVSHNLVLTTNESNFCSVDPKEPLPYVASQDTTFQLMLQA